MVYHGDELFMGEQKFTTKKRLSRKLKSASPSTSLMKNGIGKLTDVDMSPENILQLQQLIGNQAVQRMIQRTPQKGVIQRTEDDDTGPSPQATKSFSQLLAFWENIESGGNTPGSDTSTTTDTDTDSSSLNYVDSTGGGIYNTSGSGTSSLPLNYVDNTEGGNLFGSDYDSDSSDYDSSDYDSSDYDSSDYDSDFNIDLSNLNNKDKAKYKFIKPLLAQYKGEEVKSGLAIQIIETVAKAVADGKFPSLATVMKEKFNWDANDIATYLDGDKLKEGVNPKVTYVNEQDRKNYELIGGSTLKQGTPDPEPFDTSAMFSKHSGAGFGIYVMSPNGELYSNPHKVGLFHHSSFLAGLPTAGAGELKVIDGTLKYITNKSGHYQPGDEHLVQTLMELRDRGVGLTGVGIATVLGGEYNKDAAGYLEDKKHLVEGIPLDDDDSDDDYDDYDDYDDDDYDDDDDSDDDYDDDSDDDYDGNSKYVMVKDERGYMVKVLRETVDDKLDLSGPLQFSLDGTTYDSDDIYNNDEPNYLFIKDEKGYVNKVKVGSYVN